MSERRSTQAVAIGAAICICLAPSSPGASEVTRHVTATQTLGAGSAHAYALLDPAGRPIALGVSLSRRAIDNLPRSLNPASRCFDKNGNGQIEVQEECIGDHELVFELPQGKAREAFAPFRWIGVNWNPHGHVPPAPPPWSEPHFDFHFYIAPREAVNSLRPGACGELIDCEDFKRATRPVPAKFVHVDHIDVGAAVPAMGNHLINSKSPELAPGGPKFTHTFIFGADEGRISFYEPMITREFLASNPSMCARIKQPAAWEVAGYYPTKYCVRTSERTGRRTVSLEGFVERRAN